MQREKTAISRAVVVVIAVVIIVLLVGAAYIATRSTSSTTSTSTATTGPSTSSTSTATGSGPSTFTYESARVVDTLEPETMDHNPDFMLGQNLYETLIWYNGTCATCTIPWLAQNYTVSPDGKTWSFTLRQGITFQDGEPLNSTAVYFSLNRVLINDGSTTTYHGGPNSLLLQQLLNSSLATNSCGCTITYNQQYVQNVLAENFVHVTGPYTFTINLMVPSLATPALLAGTWASIIAPQFIMQHDLSVWNQTSNGYTLPYAKLSGNTMTKFNQYFDDAVATCNAGVSPGGCGNTYFWTDTGALPVGTGPYEVQSWDHTTNVITMTANPNYWGGAWTTKIVPQIKTIIYKTVADESTRVLDLKSAAAAGQAMSIDVPTSNIYDVADRTSWLNDQKMVSDIPGVTIYGPNQLFTTNFFPFGTNVTNPYTGKLQTFQPTADVRFREAFGDSVNMTEINQVANNNLGVVANALVPPGLPPTGSYNASIKPGYSYNPDEVQTLLLNMMEHPLTTFHFLNGTVAPAGLFNNTFGCTKLGSNNMCANPVPQTIPIQVSTPYPIDAIIAEQIAAVVNNVSATYNMGLTITVQSQPLIYTPSSSWYFSDEGGWDHEYAGVLDFLNGNIYPPGIYMTIYSWNIPALTTLYKQALAADAAGNSTALVDIANQMQIKANSVIPYIWQDYPELVTVMTSNVHGFQYNPSLYQIGTAGSALQLFATLYTTS